MTLKCKLYVVATPIGNLEDITLRALRVLQEVDLIAAEDTRITRKLLSHHRINNRLTSFNENNKKTKSEYILEVLTSGDVALVCDAGTPSINDPGLTLVQQCVQLGVDVVPVPGPSAITSALSISNLRPGEFTYLGFLPRHISERRSILADLSRDERVLVILEAPHRLRDLLSDVREILGNRQLVICREMTKLFEETFYGTVEEAIDHFNVVKGEFIILLSGAVHSQKDERIMKQDAKDMMLKLYEQDIRAKEAVEKVSIITGLSRRDAYNLWLEIKNSH